MEKPYIKAAIEIIVKKENKILMGKRLGTAGAGDWGLPGGHLEYGESIEAAAHRELMEETGLKADLKLVNVINDNRTSEPNSHYIHFLFEASNVIGEPQNIEPNLCEGWEWLDISDLPKNIFFGNDQVLEAYFNGQFFTDKTAK